MNEPISMKEQIDPFTGEQEKTGKLKQPPSRGLPVINLRLSVCTENKRLSDCRTSARSSSDTRRK